MPTAHDSWAEVYDEVNRRSFGAVLDVLTTRTVEFVERMAPRGCRILDIGAGTGRLALPLAERRFHVTAADPSPAMLAVLRRKAEQLGISGICTVTASAAGLPPTLREGRFDLALMVFSVVSYLVSTREFRRAARGICEALAPGGRLLIDIPSIALFRPAHYRDGGMDRRVAIDAVADGTYRYVETTAIDVAGVRRSYEDRFRLRRWRPEEVTAALAAAGLGLEDDLTGEFIRTGATYLLLVKPTRDGT
ncbi:MAG: methyltransferase domain-containing protein [Alphaproteobacteria bacterium]|nr:methyltransferase domain-containing protein [Alphaproteobacteria bacterium]